MKASELRIGNYIKQPNGVNMVFRISEGEDVNTFPEEEIEPIPLSEEWLLKFGFIKRSPNGFYFDYNRISINIPDVEYRNYRIDIKLKYVHQLQNLYFALTGEELTLKSE